MHTRLRWAGAVVLLVAVAAARADDPKPPGKPPKKGEAAAKAEPAPLSPAEQYKALEKEFHDAQQEFFKVYREAKTDQERQKLVKEKYPQPPKYAGRFLKLAQEYPDDPAALDALTWVVSNASYSTEGAKALDQLARDHVANPKVGAVCGSLVYQQSPKVEPFLKDIVAKNPDRSARGLAAYALGQYQKRQSEQVRAIRDERGVLESLGAMLQLGGERFKQMKSQDPDALAKEAEAVFERVEKEFADVEQFQRKLGALAKGELFEIRNLAVGKKAPEIEGEDVEGAKFKLSDYRGKVILLDFWGHW